MMKVGSLVLVTRRTHAGVQTIVGHVIPPLEIEEGAVTHVTVEGMVLSTKIEGLPLPIEEELPVVMELIPVNSRHPELLSVELLEESP